MDEFELSDLEKETNNSTTLDTKMQYVIIKKEML